jgi:Flp pilus assembly protein TadG
MSGRCKMAKSGLRRRLQKVWRDEKGASLVEFALILPVFALLLFAIVDFGLVFGGYISVQNEVNAAARAVSLNEVASGCPSATWSNPAFCTVMSHITVSPPPLGVKANSVHVALYFPDGTATQGHPVIVCVQASLQSTTGLTSPFLNGRTFYTKSQILLEQPTTLIPPLPPGGPYYYNNGGTFSCT